VKTAVNFDQMSRGDLSIDLGAVQFQVAQNRLDAGQVGAAEQQMGGAGVAQVVEANRFAEELAGVIELEQAAADGVAVHSLVVAGGNPEGHAGLGADPFRADFFQVEPQEMGRPAVQRQHSGPAVFAAVDVDGSAAKVDVAQVQVDQLAAAHSQSVGQFQRGPVADSLQRFQVGQLQQLVHLLDAEHQFSAGAMVADQQLLVQGLEQQALAEQEFEPAAQGVNGRASRLLDLDDLTGEFQGTSGPLQKRRCQ
jgi:hypothetical protein